MTDKKTIGLTPSGEKVIENVMELGYFKDMMDAAKFAMSIAIRDGDAPNAIEGANTIWNVGSFDSDGQIRQIIPVLYPECDTPYRAAEALVDQGLARIAVLIDSGTFDPAKVLQPSSCQN